jgi:3-hydroxy-9,10-secoandrosta-1,3,5(10)-triene-9,17-dione monooxygenase reductase component
MSTNMTAQAFDSARFRQVLGHFPTGVVAVSAIDGGQPVGLAVASFTSVSLDPPLVGFFPSKASTTWPRIARSGSFVANILAEHQQDLCQSFSASGGDKFARCTWRHGANGAPLLDGAVAWIECSVRSVLDTGDHWLVLGEVRELTARSGHSPLIFHRGQYKQLRP